MRRWPSRRTRYRPASPRSDAWAACQRSYGPDEGDNNVRPQNICGIQHGVRQRPQPGDSHLSDT
eukprot:scaffold506474_cov15-Prasinocladus_malaysianus.AAC.1